MKFDYNYYISKFEAIPEEHWYAGGSYFNYENPVQMDALGHCGDHLPGRSVEADKLCCLAPNIVCVNDGELGMGNTPKERVLNYLKELKKEDEKLYAS